MAKRQAQLEYDKFRQQTTLPDIAEMYVTSGLSLLPYDYVSRSLTNSTTETYTFKSGGASGTTTNTVVIVYTDNTLSTISTVTKT